MGNPLSYALLSTIRGDSWGRDEDLYGSCYETGVNDLQAMIGAIGYWLTLCK